MGKLLLNGPQAQQISVSVPVRTHEHIFVRSETSTCFGIGATSFTTGSVLLLQVSPVLQEVNGEPASTKLLAAT
jgi:hypothetical protein